MCCLLDGSTIHNSLKVTHCRFTLTFAGWGRCTLSGKWLTTSAALVVTVCASACTSLVNADISDFQSVSCTVLTTSPAVCLTASETALATLHKLPRPNNDPLHNHPQVHTSRKVTFPDTRLTTWLLTPLPPHPSRPAACAGAVRQC